MQYDQNFLLKVVGELYVEVEQSLEQQASLSNIISEKSAAIQQLRTTCSQNEISISDLITKCIQLEFSNKNPSIIELYRLKHLSIEQEKEISELKSNSSGLSKEEIDQLNEENRKFEIEKNQLKLKVVELEEELKDDKFTERLNAKPVITRDMIADKIAYGMSRHIAADSIMGLLESHSLPARESKPVITRAMLVDVFEKQIKKTGQFDWNKLADAVMELINPKS